MKKIFLWLVLILLLVSLIITLNSGETYVFSMSNLANIMSTCPRLNLTSVADVYRNFSISFIQNIPFVGQGLTWVVNLGHSLITLATMILQGLVFVLHFITHIFLIV